MFKVIIAGSRGFSNYKLLEGKLDSLFSKKSNVEIVSGTARGADKLGEMYAKKRSLPVIQFPADWDKYGKSAGYKRNAQMAQYADACVVFWDGKSRGTKHMIDLAKKQELQIRIFNFEGGKIEC